MDELYDKHVMVHPQLTEDPMRAQGQIGRIDVINYSDDEVFVELPNGNYGLYEADALLVLQPAESLLKNIQAHLETLPQKATLNLLNIFLMQQSHKDEMIREALEMAVADPVLQEHALVSLRDWIDNGLSDNYNYGADHQPGRGL